MLINAWTALFFTAQNVQTLLAAEILCGIVGTRILLTRLQPCMGTWVLTSFLDV
jgi:hypothetical protein